MVKFSLLRFILFLERGAILLLAIGSLFLVAKNTDGSMVGFPVTLVGEPVRIRSNNFPSAEITVGPIQTVLSFASKKLNFAFEIALLLWLSIGWYWSALSLKIIKSVETGEIFTSENERRFRAMGWITLLFYVSKLTWDLYAYWFIYSEQTVIEGNVSGIAKPYFDANGIVFLGYLRVDSFLVFGLFLLFIAHIFRKGIEVNVARNRLKDEIELTI